MADLHTVVASVQARTKHARPRATVDLPLPIYEGAFVGRFGVIDSHVLEAFQQAVTAAEELTEAERQRIVSDFVADACRVICARSDDGTEPLEADGLPVRFDEQFAAALGLDIADQSQAGVVEACWTLDDGSLNFVALNGFGIRLLEWMQDTTKPVDGEIVGESRGGAKSNGRVALPQSA